MKITIKDKVINATEELRALTTTGELRTWAIKNQMDNRAAFPKFKTALLEIGIDYDGIKSKDLQERANELESKITHELTLYVDAKASAQGYGICGVDGEVLWYGKFFKNEDADEQSDAELAAAKKAVWFALKVREELGHEAIKLNLFVDAQWLTYQDHAGQKGYALTNLAERYNIKLNVEWISGKDNPADKWTVTSGYKAWKDNPLKELATSTNQIA
jgi:hypothetical protein